MLKGIGKDKLIKIAIGVVALVVLIIVVLLIFHAINAKNNSYGDVENKLLSAAKEYYKDNENLLPKTAAEELSIDDQTLTSLGYLKNINELLDEEGINCTGKVVVTYNDEKYRYTPLLDCGDKYKTNTLTSHILTKEEKVYSGDGLYELNGEYVYRGEKPNNFVRFSGHDYRIVKISEGKTILIYNDKYLRGNWDNRFNTERNRTDGINDYAVSRLREYVDDIYKNDKIIKSSDKDLLTVFNVYIGKRSETDNYNDGSIEKSEYIENQYIGVLPLYDYINASIDNNCNSALTRSCKNYNYLNYYNYNWWTATADRSNSYRVYRVTTDGTVEVIRATSNAYIRPIIALVSDAIYVSGDGSEKNPYIVK